MPENATDRTTTGGERQKEVRRKATRQLIVDKSQTHWKLSWSNMRTKPNRGT